MRVPGRGDTLKNILNRLGWCLVMIFLGLWLFSTRTCAQDVLPDAPQVQNAPKFLSFRKSWQDPPLRTNRQMFHSKLYVASQIGGAIAMIVACRNKRSGEDWASEVPAVLAVDAMAYLGGRFFTQSFAVGPGIYEMVHYSQAATK